jgi:Family of unknown function (DUF6353)
VAITDLLKQTEQFSKENSAAILTGVGVVGTVTTAYLTGRATLKCAHILADEEFTAKEKLPYIWKPYIPAAASGILTVTSIVAANRISSRKAAALAVAYGISDRAFQEYKDKVAEKLTAPKLTALHDEIAQDKVNANPVSNNQVLIVGKGDVLCYDSYTGRYFQSSIEEIKKAVNELNHEILNHSYATLSSFYDRIGLPPTVVSEEVGWSNNELLEVRFSTTMSDDERPCLVMDFCSGPHVGYRQLY